MRGCPRRLPQQAGARAQDRQAGGDSDDAASDLDADADAADDVDDAESEDADELGGRGSACARRRRPPARLALGGGLPDEPAAAPAVGTPTRARSQRISLMARCADATSLLLFPRVSRRQSMRAA